MTTTVMLKTSEAKLLEEARDGLLHEGLNSLGPEFRNELSKIEIERLSKGAVIAVGSLLLLYLIKKNRG